MTGTLAGALAGRGVPLPTDRCWSEVEGDIEKVDNTLKITQIRVKYHLQVPRGKTEAVDRAMSVYLDACPCAQSVLGCIDLVDEAMIEEIDE